MSKSNHNIDETFRDAFQNWEADYSMQEMNADWDAFSKNIPQPQAPQNPVVKSPLKNPWSAGKILGLSSVAGVIITAATLVLYNNSNDDNNKLSQISLETDNLPKTEQIIEEKSVNTSTETITSANLEENNKAESVITLKDNRKVQNSQLETKSSQKTTVKEDILLFDNNIFTNQLPQPKQPTESNKAEIVKASTTIKLNDTAICLSAPLHIYNSINNKNAEMRVEWGDGKSLVAANRLVSHNYEKSGVYNLKIVSGTETIYREVTVKAAPQAHFTHNQSNGLSCKFKNQSEGAYGYKWIFGDNSEPQNSFHAEHTFPDTGRYLVKLVVFNASGCTDTLPQWVNVSNTNKFYIPNNAITPNNDGSNDVFEVKIEGSEFYEVLIFDRSGHIVFRSNDKNNFWKGNNQNNGEPCQAGTYYYSIKYRLPGENVNNLTGTVTIIR